MIAFLRSVRRGSAFLIHDTPETNVEDSQWLPTSFAVARMRSAPIGTTLLSKASHEQGGQVAQ